MSQHKCVGFAMFDSIESFAMQRARGCDILSGGRMHAGLAGNVGQADAFVATGMFSRMRHRQRVHRTRLVVAEFTIPSSTPLAIRRSFDCQITADARCKRDDLGNFEYFNLSRHRVVGRNLNHA